MNSSVSVRMWYAEGDLSSSMFPLLWYTSGFKGVQRFLYLNETWKFTPLDFCEVRQIALERLRSRLSTIFYFSFVFFSNQGINFQLWQCWKRSTNLTWRSFWLVFSSHPSVLEIDLYLTHHRARYPLANGCLLADCHLNIKIRLS